MAMIHPLRALRPLPTVAPRMACLPYDVLSSAEAQQQAAGNPLSFLHVEKAEIDLDLDIDPTNPQVYTRAGANLDEFMRQGVLVQESTACFYIYRETLHGRSQTGLVACTSIDEYRRGQIKVHEHTRPDKVQDRKCHIEACNAQTGLIFLAYRTRAAITELLTHWTTSYPPIYDFASEDNVQHTVWVIADKCMIARVVTLFNAVETLYIADGHHRTEAAAQVGLARQHQMTGHSEANLFLSVLFPGEELTIMDYNRVVRDLQGQTPTQFLAAVATAFDVQPVSGTPPYHPNQRHTFGMYLAGVWYQLTAKSGTYRAEDPVEVLDTWILQHNLLQPILGINDPRTDVRIDFVGGIRGLAELEHRTQSAGVAFALYPVTMADIYAVADAGQILPPKSTWFEPKLRSGLFIHQLS
jgi:uncharacterized protein (DUF1015 family)